jgi:hypothetical protein
MAVCTVVDLGKLKFVSDTESKRSVSVIISLALKTQKLIAATLTV